MVLVRAGRAHRAGARLAVAGRHIEKLPGGMRPGILDIGGQGDAAARCQRGRARIQVIEVQLGPELA